MTGFGITGEKICLPLVLLVPILSICGLGEWGWAKLGDWVEKILGSLDPWGKGVKKANMVQLSNSVKYIFLKNNVVY